MSEKKTYVKEIEHDRRETTTLRFKNWYNTLSTISHLEESKEHGLLREKSVP
jgi:hypothetical protein